MKKIEAIIQPFKLEPVKEALKTIGKTLVMTVGGASGPLYGSFFLGSGLILPKQTQGGNGEGQGKLVHRRTSFH